MLASVARHQDAATASQAAPQHAQPGDGQQANAEQPDSAGETEGAPGEEAKKKTDVSMPPAALQVRLDRERAKAQRIQDALNSTSLEVARRDAAIRLLTQELETIKARVNSSDPRDEQLRSYALQEEARKAFEAVQEEHRQKLEQQRAQAELSEKRAAIRDQMREACQRYPGVEFEMLKAAMLKSENGDPHAVAAQLHERLRSLFSASPGQRPEAPPHVRGGTATTTRPPNTEASMVEYVKTMLAKG